MISISTVDQRIKRCGAQIPHGHSPSLEVNMFEQLERNDETFWWSLSAQGLPCATGQILHDRDADVLCNQCQRVKRKTQLDAAPCDLTQTISTAPDQNRCAVKTFTWNITYENLHHHRRL
ncbi:hypothetical protein [Yoonia sp.]|uniref:hypothetical protein n=1 Tax=Yoonia sp. TaxID=2212373 RepID=UPI00358FA526